MLHGRVVHDRCLVGINAVVMDRAVVGSDAMVGAGSLVPPGMVVPPRALVTGSPARIKRDLTAEEVTWLAWASRHYVDLARGYLPCATEHPRARRPPGVWPE